MRTSCSKPFNLLKNRSVKKNRKIVFQFLIEVANLSPNSCKSGKIACKLVFRFLAWHMFQFGKTHTQQTASTPFNTADMCIRHRLYPVPLWITYLLTRHANSRHWHFCSNTTHAVQMQRAQFNGKDILLADIITWTMQAIFNTEIAKTEKHTFKYF